jgi:BirA family biotin operon repressor/biotin-[acetyl-CoA-carboxylase] ligase
MGIGINVNIEGKDFPPDVRSIATSIQIELGRRVPRLLILRSILKHFDRYYRQVLEGRPDELFERIKERSVVLGKRVRVRTLRQQFEGKALGIATPGFLIVERDDGRLERILAGDVEILD